jgi:tetratricopeptide (TPR) repeat protein
MGTLMSRCQTRQVFGYLLLALLIGLASAGSSFAADVPIRLSDLYAILNEVAAHAKSYPPKFASSEERAQVEEHLHTLLAQTDKILIRYPDDKDVLFIAGAGNAMGHNLDFPGCADKAIGDFDRLLTIDPNNRRALFEYGGFLSGTTLLDKAIPPLERAIQLGEERAHYTLGFVYLKKGDIAKTLPELEAYLKFDPENATAQKVVADIKAGKAPVHVVHHE